MFHYLFKIRILGAKEVFVNLRVIYKIVSQKYSDMLLRNYILELLFYYCFLFFL